jgi:hypothetical protein
MKHSGIIFIISDFLAEGYETTLRRLARLHDVIAISIGDVREFEIPEMGSLLLSNPETGQEMFVDTSSYLFKKWHKEYLAKLEERTQDALKGGQVEFLKVRTQDDYADAVVRFFRKRAKRKARK